MDKKQKKRQRKELVQAYTSVLQFSITMIVPILACTFLGYFLDTKLGTSYLVIVGFFIGSLSGINGIYRICRKIIKKDSQSPGNPVTERKKEGSKKK